MVHGNPLIHELASLKIEKKPEVSKALKTELESKPEISKDYFFISESYWK